MTTYFEVCSKIWKNSLNFFTFVQYYCKQPFFYPAQALGKMYQPVGTGTGTEKYLSNAEFHV